MNFLPLVIRAEYREGYRIRLTFNDGRQKTVGFSGAGIEPARPSGKSQASRLHPVVREGTRSPTVRVRVDDATPAPRAIPPMP